MAIKVTSWKHFPVLLISATLFSALSLAGEFDKVQESNLPSVMKEHINQNYHSEKYVNSLMSSFVNLNSEDIITKRESAEYLLDTRDFKITTWLLLQPTHSDFAISILNGRNLEYRDSLPIGIAMITSAWEDNVIRPVEGDADDPSHLIEQLGNLFCKATGTAFVRPSKSKDGYYHKSEIRKWCNNRIKIAIAKNKVSESESIFLEFCAAKLAEDRGGIVQ